MKLENIVPWGRNLNEYREMFLLTDNELKSKILGCGDGPASFNAQINALGGRVISIDPTYSFSKKQIKSRIDEVADEVMIQVKKKQEDFVWKNIKTPDELYTIRMSAMKIFLEDYEKGKEQGRYRFEMLPKLSFKNNQFDIALSSHFLFLYSEHLDEEFHREAILEMLRVAKDVRIFPIISLDGKKSPYLDNIMNMVTELGYRAEIITTAYEFQKGGNEMLKIMVED